MSSCSYGVFGELASELRPRNATGPLALAPNAQLAWACGNTGPALGVFRLVRVPSQGVHAAIDAALPLPICHYFRLWVSRPARRQFSSVYA